MSQQKCSHGNTYGIDTKCNFNTFENEDKCIFHCDKTLENGWIIEKDTSDSSQYKYKWDKGKVNCFWNNLYRYVNILLKLEKKEFPKKKCSFPLHNHKFYISNAINITRQGRGGEDFFKIKQTICFQGIKFPPTLNVPNRIINSKIKEIRELRYSFCYFYDSLIDNNHFSSREEAQVNSKIHFHDCEIEDTIEFERFNSNYNKKIDMSNCKIGKSIIFMSEFSEILLENIEVKNIIINSSEDRYENYALHPTYNKLVIRDSIVETIFTANKVTINEFVIKNLKGKVNELILNKIDIGKLYIKSFPIKIFNIYNVDFLENSKILFEDLEVDNFDITKISQDSKYIQFNNIQINTKFLSKKVEFRNTYFNNFNVEKADIEIEKTSFIDSHLNDIKWGNISKINAPKQVFRQLKFVNDKQANYIEANNFYTMEMKKYEEELSEKSWFTNFWQEKLVFVLGNKISNFGQSWFLPLIWLLICNLGFFYLKGIVEKGYNIFQVGFSLIFFITFFWIVGVFIYKYGKYKKRNYYIIPHMLTVISLSIHIWYFHLGDLDKVSEFISLSIPKNDPKVNDYIGIWLLNKAVSGFIIYHFIIALRRQTKR